MSVASDPSTEVVPLAQLGIPVGTSEVGDIFDVCRGTVGAWRTRGVGFPAPAFTVGRRPAWALEDVIVWAQNTGRGNMIKWGEVFKIRESTLEQRLRNRLFHDDASSN